MPITFERTVVCTPRTPEDRWDETCGRLLGGRAFYARVAPGRTMPVRLVSVLKTLHERSAHEAIISPAAASAVSGNIRSKRENLTGAE